MAFTKEQQLAIDTHGSNIIVSAGAGSGKTAVLTERIFKMLTQGYDISRLLVLTFTNAAALEMKTRIKKRVVESGTLKEQVNKIDNAFITTFDSFALSLVKKYHYLLGVAKQLNIVDEVVISLKKNEIIDEVFNEFYSSGNERFFDLLNKFTFKDDKELRRSILNIAKKLEKKPNKEKYLKSYIQNYYKDEVINEFINIYKKECNERVKDLKLTANELYTMVADSKLGESLVRLLDFIEYDNDYEAIVAFFSTYKLESSPRGCDEEIKELRSNFKKEIDKFIADFLKFDNTIKMKESLLETKNYVSVIIDILLEYFKRVNAYKMKCNLFEFDDISMMVLELFNKYPEVLEEVSNSFDEILLDEYQDTSDIQEEFITKISRDNVYMVGDIKQSIYRFRNANPYIFKEKYDNYKNTIGGIKIDLNKNFRSRKEVLENINLMFNHLMTQSTGDADYVAEHQMNFGNTKYEANKNEEFSYDQEYLVYEPDETKYFSNEEIETFIIANKIKELMNSNKMVFDKDLGCLRPMTFSDIAIILPRKKQVSLIERIFTNLGIPLCINIDDQITDSVIIRVLTSVINLVATVDTLNITDYKYYFVSVARSFLFRVSDNWILNESFKDFKDNDIFEKALKVKEYSKFNSATKTFEYLLKVFDVYNNLIKIGDVDEHLTVISFIANLISNLTTYGYNFIDIAEHLKVIIDEEIEINYSKKTGNNGVVLINIHKSKGLEYPVCFFCDLTAGFNRADIKESFLFDKDFGFITPFYQEAKEDTILKILYKNKYIKEDISERIRLFYVALTRAREKMYFVLPNYNNLKVVASPFLFSSYSHFISYYYDEAIAKYVKNIKYDDMVNKDYLEITSKDYKSVINKTTPIIYEEKKFISSTLTNTNISKKLDILLDHETANLLKLGTHLHEILQIINFKTKDLSSLILTKDEEKLLSKLLSLPCFNEIHKAKIYKELEFEYNINGKHFNGIIDLLVEYEDHYEIIDYKLFDIDKPEYVKQLNEYYNYVKMISNKKIKMYLLSIVKAELKEIPVTE